MYAQCHMFAGIMFLDPAGRPSSDCCKAISRNLSRIDRPGLTTLAVGPTFVARINSGALFDHDGLLPGTGRNWCAMAGEPISIAGTPRADQANIHRAICEGSTLPLKACRGVFCGASFCITDGMPVLRLFGDKLGIRPLYYWHDNEKVVFASALRILEQLPFVAKRRSDAGVAELIAFGFPLGDRTQYDGISVIREAEVIEFSLEGPRKTQYMRWTDLPTHTCSRASAVVEIQTRFHEAISIRRQDDTRVAAFLSGGMDSRAIVAALHCSGAEVQGLNFSPAGSQDRELARSYASTLGIPLLAHPRTAEPKGGFRLALTRYVDTLIEAGEVKADRPRALWSGDGGSVAVGNVHLDDQLVQALRRGARQEAIREFFKLNQIGFPYRLLRPEKHALIKEFLFGGVNAELDRLECADPGQSLFLFLMMNDQRRHLYDVYEELDLHRLEYQLPFFDIPLLEFIYGLPIEYRNNHRFYSDWFNAFPPTTRAVPWQTYPGHVPCPLQIPQQLTYQWRTTSASLTARLAKRLRYGAHALRLATLKPDLGPVSRSRLAMIGAVQLLGLRDYAYVVKAADWFGDLAGGLTR